MDITLRTPLSFTEIGKKDTQEDRLYPQSGANAANRTFILCDGMGGHARGEVAAEIVSGTLGRKLDSDSAAGVSTAVFNEALSCCYKALDENLPCEDSRRPGTTLTCIRLGDNGVLAAHIGDSRIYQVRPGVGIMFRTEDHSLVNELVRAGQITEAEARVHPRRNVITRAMMPGTTNPPHADTMILTDVRDGDFFFLCCDGVLEKLTEARLIKILSNSATTDAAKISAIKAVCDTGTRDNYTVWLIPVDRVEGNDSPEGRPVITLEDATAGTARAEARAFAAQKSERKATGRQGIIYGAGILVLCAIIAVLTIMLFSGDDDKEEGKQADRIESPEAAETTPEAAPADNGAGSARGAAERVRGSRKAGKETKTETAKPDKPEPAAKPEVKPEETVSTPEASAAAAAAAMAKKPKKNEPQPQPEPQAVPEPEPKPEPANDPAPAPQPITD